MCSVQYRPEILTPRLALRPLEAVDAPALARLIDDEAIARMTSRVPHPYSLDDAEGFIAYARTGPEKVFAIEKHEGELAGVIGFHGEPATPEIGYWIGRPHWGKGYATEAGRAAMDWAHRRWGKRALRAGHFADNPASGRVLDKLGFLYTGEVRRMASVARGEPVDTRMMVWLP
jgi:RimJ/RimL family protein N-acetyltransferase